MVARLLLGLVFIGFIVTVALAAYYRYVDRKHERKHEKEMQKMEHRHSEQEELVELAEQESRETESDDS